MRIYTFLLVVIVGVRAANTTPKPEDTHKEVDPNLIKPSDKVIEQVKIYDREPENQWRTMQGDEVGGGRGIAGDSKQTTPDSNNPTESEEKIIEQEQLQAAESSEATMQKQQPEWLRKQRQALQSLQSPPKKQQFHFLLNDSQSLNLILDLHNTTDDDGRIFFQVKVFSDQGNRYVQPNRPAQSTSLNLKVRFTPSSSDVFALDKNIYMHGRYTLQFRTMYYLEFTNNYDRNLYVMVAVEMMRRQVKGSGGDVGGVLGKMAALAEKEKDSKVSFKWQMGFKQMNQEHEATLLMLTSLELVCIVLTTILQVSCLKQLIDNKSLV